MRFVSLALASLASALTVSPGNNPPDTGYPSFEAEIRNLSIEGRHSAANPFLVGRLAHQWAVRYEPRQSPGSRARAAWKRARRAGRAR